MTDTNKNDLGQGDARTTAEPMSRFRPRYRKLSDAELALHDELKSKADELDRLIARVPPENSPSSEQARYRALAVTNLELAIMWAVKALTA